MFSSGHMWTWASGIEVSLTGYEKSGGALDQYMAPASRDLRGFADFLEEFGYDDQAWWGNAWVRAYDLTGKRDYLDLAGRIFADMRAAWDEGSCGGGVWWNPNRDFKNAVTAELFILLAANLHNRTPGDTEYLAWAERSWQWFMGIGMVNDQKLINDGLRDCQNKGEPVWTYNQGIILGAAVELYRATGDEQYLTVAQGLADASTTLLVDAQGIFRERCEASGDCNDDQSAFKGIYQRYLTSLYEITGKPEYGAFLLRHARSIWSSRNADNAFGLSWSGPIDRVDSQRQIAAANALAALAPPQTVASRFVRAAGGTSFNHEMGHPAGSRGWGCDAGSCPAAGLMQTGPYFASLPPGAHVLHVQLSVSRTSAQATPLVELEVYGENGSQVLARREVSWSEFGQRRARQDFAVPFVYDAAQGPLSFRVRWLGAEKPPELIVSDLSVGPASSLSAAGLEHACGRLHPLELWVTDRHHEGEDCTMLSGGGLALAGGPTVARFELAVDDFAHDDEPVATLTVTDQADGHELATRTLTRHAFSSTLLHGFDLAFSAEPGQVVDFAVKRLASAHAPRLSARAVHVRAAIEHTPVTLPLDAVGIRESSGNGALDDAGSSFAAQALERPYYAGGHEFVLGPLNGTGPNMLSANGQVIALPAVKASELELLVLATYGTQSGAFRVEYQDGTSASFERSISDWWESTLQPDEEFAVAAPYFWAKSAKQYGNFHMFVHRLPLDGSKVPATLKLPNNTRIKVFAVTAISPQ